MSNFLRLIIQGYMNNQMPYMNIPNYNQGNYPNNSINMQLERLNNRINRLERQIKILENRINRLENVSVMPLNNNQDDNDMYML